MNAQILKTVSKNNKKEFLHNKPRIRAKVDLSETSSTLIKSFDKAKMRNMREKLQRDDSLKSWRKPNARILKGGCL